MFLQRANRDLRFEAVDLDFQSLELQIRVGVYRRAERRVTVDLGVDDPRSEGAAPVDRNRSSRSGVRQRSGDTCLPRAKCKSSGKAITRLVT